MKKLLSAVSIALTLAVFGLPAMAATGTTASSSSSVMRETSTSISIGASPDDWQFPDWPDEPEVVGA